jgi:integrase
VGYLHSTLRVALQRAVKKRLVPYNVARDAEPPAQRQREIKTLSREELATFFEEAKGDRYEAFFVMGALSGLRPGEMLALRWADLQLPEASGDPGVARIRRSLSKLPSGKLLMRETTKTGRGRAVHLLPEVVAALKAHRRRQLEERMAKGTLWDEQDLVFPNARGKPTNRDNLSKRHFKPILKKAGLPLDLGLYTLRHTFATLWLESGEHPKILQEILGHSRIHTTLDVYSHALPHMQREAMGRFGERFRIQPESRSGS